MKHNILCTVPMKEFPDVKDILNSKGNVTYLDYPDYDEVYNIIDDMDAIFPNARMTIDSKLLSKAKKLQLIAMPAMGTDHIDIEKCNELGIYVFSMSGNKDFMRNVWSTAEYTIGMMLSLLKKYRQSSDSVLTFGSWNAANFRGYDLRDKTVGVIGYGVVGSQVVNLAKAFGAKIKIYDPYARTGGYHTLEDVARLSDIITCHVPLTDETKGMVNKKIFDQMDNVYFINASRGEVINDNDLIEALKNGNVQSAALDVISKEADGNIDSHPLVEYARINGKLLITPHCAGSSMDALSKVFTHTAKVLINNLRN